MNKTLERYLFSRYPVTDEDGFFSGRARVARIVLARRREDPRTNDELCAAMGLGTGNVVSLLLRNAVGDLGTRPMSDDNLIRLARLVGCDPVLETMGLLLVEDASPLIAGLLRCQMADADPHAMPLRDLVIAMADGIVVVPPGTAPAIAARIEEARLRAEEASSAWVATTEALDALWRNQEAEGTPRSIHGDEGHRLMSMAEAMAGT